MFKRKNWQWIRWAKYNYLDSLACHECWYCHGQPGIKYDLMARISGHYAALVENIWNPLKASLLCSWLGHKRKKWMAFGYIEMDVCTRCHDATPDYKDPCTP